MQRIAQHHNASVAQVALAWLLANPTVTRLLLGATKQTQLDDNLGAIRIKLSREEQDQLSEATALAPLYPHWFNRWVSDKAVIEALRPHEGNP